jgi:hypothetical protein
MAEVYPQPEGGEGPDPMTEYRDGSSRMRRENVFVAVSSPIIAVLISSLQRGICSQGLFANRARDRVLCIAIAASID